MPDVLTVEQVARYVGSELAGADADLLSAALLAAEKAINHHCQRRFFVGAASSARLYVPSRSDGVLRIHDCSAVASVSNDGTAVTSTDYQLEPLNALSWSGDARPYEQIRLLSGSWARTTTGEATVSVTATWGWPAIPAEVTEATKIMVKDLVAARDTRFGIAGFTDFAGVRVRENTQVAELLRDLRRVESWGIA